MLHTPACPEKKIRDGCTGSWILALDAPGGLQNHSAYVCPPGRRTIPKPNASPSKIPAAILSMSAPKMMPAQSPSGNPKPFPLATRPPFASLAAPGRPIRGKVRVHVKSSRRPFLPCLCYSAAALVALVQAGRSDFRGMVRCCGMNSTRGLAPLQSPRSILPVSIGRREELPAGR